MGRLGENKQHWALPLSCSGLVAAQGLAASKRVSALLPARWQAWVWFWLWGSWELVVSGLVWFLLVGALIEGAWGGDTSRSDRRPCEGPV